jgi:ABC-type transporter lipoprotein component MlaA
MSFLKRVAADKRMRTTRLKQSYFTVFPTDIRQYIQNFYNPVCVITRLLNNNGNVMFAESRESLGRF